MIRLLLSHQPTRGNSGVAQVKREALQSACVRQQLEAAGVAVLEDQRIILIGIGRRQHCSVVRCVVNASEGEIQGWNLTDICSQRHTAPATSHLVTDTINVVVDGD